MNRQVNVCWVFFLIIKNLKAKIPQKTLYKKWSFPLRISSVNLTKSAGNCRFGHIYWRNPWWKTSFFVQWNTWNKVKKSSRKVWHLQKSTRPEVFLEKGVLKICNKFTGEHPYLQRASMMKYDFNKVTKQLY